MKWSIWHYPTNECIAVEFDTYAEAEKYLHPETQAIVMRGSTEIDANYGWGDVWECGHALHPSDCVHCNPEHRNAHTEWCPRCCGENKAQTWHVPIEGEKALMAIAYSYVPVDDFAYFELRDLAASVLEGKAVKCLACGHPHETVKED